MLLLVTIVLVLLAALTLAIGIVGDNLALIFVSIGASAVAAIVLAVLSATNKRRSPADAAPTADLAAKSEVQEHAAASIAGVGQPVGKTGGEAPTQATPVTRDTSTTVGLPIDDYDSLRVSEILPLLGNLDLDELEDVAQHEEANKNRATVLNKIDALMDGLEADEAASPSGGGVAEEAAASIEEIGEPIVAVRSATSDDDFPIAGYDDLDEDELIALLADLDADELETVADREEAGANRDAVLDAIDDRLDVLEGVVAAPAKKTAAKKTAAKKTAAKKTAAKKTAAKKTAAKKTAATQAPARKTAAAKAPAAKKTTAKKTAARKTPAKKTAAAKKTTTKRTPAKKAAKSTKRATKR